MKHFGIGLAFTICSCSAWAQTVVSSCIGSAESIAFYTNDADRLAVQITDAAQTSYFHSPTINPGLRDSLMRALIAVYNTDFPARDTVTNQLDIHTFGNPDLRKFVIAADSNQAWMTQLRCGNFPTGNFIVDNLINLYGLEAVNYQAWSFSPYHSVWMQSAQNYNTAALARQFEVLPGVFYTEAEFTMGGGNNIQVKVESTHIELSYVRGWEDCSSGCVKRRYWKFNVYFDCQVEYRGSFGDVLPVEGTAGLGALETNGHIALYPNPFLDEISIHGLETEVTVELQNVLGEVVRTEKTLGNKISGLQDLPAGVYVIRFENAGKQVLRKIIHQ